MDSRPLRILEIITPSRYSGAERVVTYLSAALARRGHEVLVATKPLPLLEQELARRGVSCRALPLSGKLNPRVGRLLREVIRDFRPDVVHTHLSTATWWGAGAAHREGLPCVAHVHGLTSLLWYRRADLLVGPSHGATDFLLAHRLPPARVAMVYNGLDPADFEGLPSRAEVRRQLGLPPAAPVVGTVAHLSAKKGHRILLQAMAELSGRYPDLQVVLMGEGPLRGRLEQLTRRLGLEDRVHFLGYRHDALALTPALDVTVLPSLRHDTLGLCLVEAAFLGIPGVGSDAPGIREAIEAEVTGLLARTGDPQELARALDRLLADADLRARLGQAAQRRARELFTLEAQAAAMEELFRAVIHARGGA